MVVMVLSAHSDDAVLGAGGVIARCSKEGERVIVVICSAGEASPVWALDKKQLIKTRIEEAKKADKILGAGDTIFLGQSDARLSTRQEFITKKITKLLKKYKPQKIFVHHARDLHPDHKAVWTACKSALETTRLKTSVYGFEVNSWFTPFVKENQVLIDISNYHKKKMKALKQFESQKYLLLVLVPVLYLKSFYYGSIYGFKYAEHFYKY